MNDTNLIPFTPDNAKANGAKGGKVSGEVKRQKRLIKEYLQDLLSMQAPKEEIDNNYNIGDTNGAMVAIRTLKSAKNGDVKALRLLFEVLGELDTKGKINIEIETQAAYDRGFRDGQAEIFELLSDTALRELLHTLNTGEKPKENLAALADVCGLTYTGFRKETEEKPLIFPNGTIIYGESKLE